MITTSFKTNREATQDGTILPPSPTIASYTSLFTRREFGALLHERADRDRSAPC